ncbi:MAG: hypothetical protein QOC95_263 [Thermoleophilaceae bacterium]|nr:hypothetical protein [Thermoleophilaceae bacterium]
MVVQNGRVELLGPRRKLRSCVSLPTAVGVDSAALTALSPAAPSPTQQPALPRPRSRHRKIPHRRLRPPSSRRSPESLNSKCLIRIPTPWHLGCIWYTRKLGARGMPGWSRTEHLTGTACSGGHESKRQARRYARTARTRRLCAASAGRSSCAGCGGRASRWCSGSARDDRRCRDRSNLRPHSCQGRRTARPGDCRGIRFGPRHLDPVL